MAKKDAKGKGKFLKFGNLWQKEDKNGEVRLYIQLDKGIKAVHVEAEDYQGNDISGTLEITDDGGIFLNAEAPEDRLAFRLSKEYIDQPTHDKLLKTIPENLQLEITTRVE
jgi:hypothetical protein